MNETNCDQGLRAKRQLSAEVWQCGTLGGVTPCLWQSQRLCVEPCLFVPTTEMKMKVKTP